MHADEPEVTSINVGRAETLEHRGVELGGEVEPPAAGHPRGEDLVVHARR